MAMDIDDLPGIENNTGRTTRDFVAAALQHGMADPQLKPGVRMAWPKPYDPGHGHAVFMAHDIRNGIQVRGKEVVA